MLRTYTQAASILHGVPFRLLSPCFCFLNTGFQLLVLCHQSGLLSGTKTARPLRTRSLTRKTGTWSQKGGICMEMDTRKSQL